MHFPGHDSDRTASFMKHQQFQLFHIAPCEAEIICYLSSAPSLGAAIDNTFPEETELGKEE